MEIGTGIFLGALVISVVALYIATKDRWNWRAIVIRSTLGITSAAILVFGCLWIMKVYGDRVVTLNEFLGVSLADAVSDIKFKKGEPLVSSDRHWSFGDVDGNPTINILFKNERVKAVIYNGSCGCCNHIAQLGIGSSYDEVLSKLGQPTHISESKDSLMRIVNFDKTHMVFHVAKGKVIAYGIFNPELGPVEFGR